MKRFAALVVSLLVLLGVGCSGGASTAVNKYADIDPLGFLANNVSDMSINEVKKFNSKFVEDDPEYLYYDGTVTYFEKPGNAMIALDGHEIARTGYSVLCSDESASETAFYCMEIIEATADHFGNYEVSMRYPGWTKSNTLEEADLLSYILAYRENMDCSPICSIDWDEATIIITPLSTATMVSMYLN